MTYRTELIKVSFTDGDCCVFRLLWPRVDGKYLLRFESENAVSQFLRRSVYEDHLKRFQSELAVIPISPAQCGRKTWIN